MLNQWGNETTNLLQETVDVLREHGKTPADVLWVGSLEFYTDWDNFAAIAAEENYYNGFGGAEIDCSLLIVGCDWWLEREEYDGSEWWAYKCKPIKPKTSRVFTNARYISV